MEQSDREQRTDEAKPSQVISCGYQVLTALETSLPDEGQLANEREVIRCQARERCAIDAELCGMQGGVHSIR